MNRARLSTSASRSVLAAQRIRKISSSRQAAYGVEIRLDDGSQVEVDLDADFNVIGQERDDD